MTITTIVTIIIAILVISVIGSIIFTKKEQAAAERRQKIASFKYKADEAQDMYDGLLKAGLEKVTYRFLLERIEANLNGAAALDPKTPGIMRRLNETREALKSIDETTFYVDIPSGAVELNGLISRLNKLMKYIVLLYQRRAIDDSLYQKLLPSIQKTQLKFDAEGHIKLGHQAANEKQFGTAKQSYLHARERLLESGSEDAYAQQQLQKLDELLAHLKQSEIEAKGEMDPALKVGKRTTIAEDPSLSEHEKEQIHDAVSSQEELNKQRGENLDEKKKW